MNDHIVSIIPARGGSQRMAGKNLVPLAGKPLLAHTICAARESRFGADVYVSTECPHIAAVAREWGAKIIDRPADLARDETPTEPALIHALHEIEARKRPVDILILLQATSPLRQSDRIDEGVTMMLETGCDSVVGVVPDIGYYFLGDLDAAGNLSMGYDPKRRQRTQCITPRYRENGAIYLMRREVLVQESCRMGGTTRALIMDRAESIDIDEWTDLWVCETFIDRDAERYQPAQRPPKVRAAQVIPLHRGS